MIELLDFLEYDLTFVLLMACLAIFAYLAVRSRSVRSFQFQISVFVLIWIAGELANVLLENGLISLPASLQQIGYETHLASMLFFGVFLYGRYYTARRRGHQLIEDIGEESSVGPENPK